jgi:cyd operon protein YbgT
MWYFTWILGVAFAVMFAAGCALWFENQDAESLLKDPH